MTDRMTSSVLLAQTMAGLAGSPSRRIDLSQNSISLDLLARSTLIGTGGMVTGTSVSDALPASEADIIRAIVSGRRT